MEPLKDRIALVTGGAHRIGKAIAAALARRGVRIALHYSSSAEKMRETYEEFTESGYDVHVFQSDFSRSDAPQLLMEKVITHFGALDILINSAAVMWKTPLETLTVQQWDQMFAINARAPFFLSLAAREALVKSRGTIVNIADLAAYETWPAYIPHGLTKATVVDMTRALAKTFAPEVRVNAVAPGAVLLPEGWDQEASRRLADTTPLKRIGEAEDVARAVLYLVEADYVTGDVIFVDGGRHVRQ